MTRIVSGSAKGRTLRVPKSGTRPTADRVREGLFSRLEHRGYIEDCNVLDLYSGSGAIGLEAKSRGANVVVCVEAAKSAAQVIANNARDVGLDIELYNMKAETFLATEPSVIYDLAVLDPPYDIAEESLSLVLELLVAHLADDGMVVVERSKKSPEPAWPAALQLEDERRWGDTRVWSAVRDASANEAHSSNKVAV